MCEYIQNLFFVFLSNFFLFFVWQAIFPFINSFICPLSNDSDHNNSDRKWKMQVFCCCWLMNLKKWKQTTNFKNFFSRMSCLLLGKNYFCFLSNFQLFKTNISGRCPYEHCVFFNVYIWTFCVWTNVDN